MKTVLADPNINIDDMLKPTKMIASMSVARAAISGGSKEDIANAMSNYDDAWGKNVVEQRNKDLINNIGAPVFAAILNQESFNPDKVTYRDTINILNHISINQFHDNRLGSMMPDIGANRPENYVHEDNKLHLLAYASALIGKAMNAECSLAITTVNNNPVHLDISSRRPQPIQEPKKPNWFVRNLTFLSKSFQEKMSSYNAAKAKYDAEKGANEAAIQRFDDMNTKNYQYSEKAVQTKFDMQRKGEKTPATVSELLGKSTAKTTEKQQPQLEAQKTMTAGPR